MADFLLLKERVSVQYKEKRRRLPSCSYWLGGCHILGKFQPSSAEVTEIPIIQRTRLDISDKYIDLIQNVQAGQQE